MRMGRRLREWGGVCASGAASAQVGRRLCEWGGVCASGGACHLRRGMASDRGLRRLRERAALVPSAGEVHAPLLGLHGWRFNSEID